MHRSLTLGLASTMLLIASGADASVIYNWEPLADGTDTYTDGGQVILSDAAYRSGGATFNLREDYFDYEEGNYPIRYVGLTYGNLDGADISSDNYDYTSKRLDATLNVHDDGTLGGYVNLVGFTSRFEATSDTESGDWAVVDLATDSTLVGPDYRCQGTVEAPCAGFGRFVLDESTVPTDVPTPSAWLLYAIGAGLVGGFASRRRNIG